MPTTARWRIARGAGDSGKAAAPAACADAPSRVATTRRADWSSWNSTLNTASDSVSGPDTARRRGTGGGAGVELDDAPANATGARSEEVATCTTSRTTSLMVASSRFLNVATWACLEPPSHRGAPPSVVVSASLPARTRSAISREPPSAVATARLSSVTDSRRCRMRNSDEELMRSWSMGATQMPQACSRPRISSTERDDTALSRQCVTSMYLWRATQAQP